MRKIEMLCTIITVSLLAFGAQAQESMIEKKEVKPGVGAHKRGGEASIPNPSAAGEPHVTSF